VIRIRGGNLTVFVLQLLQIVNHSCKVGASARSAIWPARY